MLQLTTTMAIPRFRHEFKKILSLMFCCKVYVAPLRVENHLATTSHTPNHNNASVRSRQFRYKARYNPTSEDSMQPNMAGREISDCRSNSIEVEREPFTDGRDLEVSLGRTPNESVKHGLQIQLRSNQSNRNEEIEPFFKPALGSSNVASVITVTIDSK